MKRFHAQGKHIDNSQIEARCVPLPADVLERPDSELGEFQREIQAAHGATAKLVAREKVYEVFPGDTVWEGEVLVFELLDHLSVGLCYAWEMDGEITVVLGEWPVDSAPAAVKAAIGC